ncbi:MAG: antitoxin [Lachnospiraceae bacterium]|nr:antitoxin [Lachnospiraceae bacterium]
MAFSIRLTDEERMLAESYAKLHSFSLAEAFKRALFEKIEDEYDIAVANDAYKEYVDSGRKSTPAADFWRELDEEI